MSTASTSMSAVTTKSLAYIDIQHDALAVFDDVEQGIVQQEDIWVSAYRGGESSVHGKIRVAMDGGVEMSCRGGVNVVRESKSNFLISVPALNITFRPVHFPKQTLVPPYTKASAVAPELSINAIDYSPKSGQLAVGGPDGYAVAIDPAAPASVVEFKGHVGDVLDVKWFPSGEVVLTASSDMSLRIFSSVTGVNPRTLRGHTRAITSTHILGVGRQVLSGGKDGTVRLWNVGAAKEERQWRLKQPVEAMIVVDDERGLSALASSGVQGEVILAATPDGSLAAFALDSDSADPLFATPPSASKLISAAYSPELELIATGHADGTIVLRHLAALSSSEPTQTVVKRNEAAIYSLAFDGPSLLVGTAAGLPARLALDIPQDSGLAIGVSVAEEFAGWEAVGVETWAVATDGAWCAGSDGVLRRY